MEKIDIDNYLGYERTWPEKRREKRKEKGPPTKSDKERRQQEIQAVRQARVEKAENRIARHLSFFPETGTDEGQKQTQSYIKWVKDSLALKYPRLSPKDENEVRVDSLIASVKAGGQHRQKNRTAVRVTHRPTLIWAKNEDERSLEQNKHQAMAALFLKLEEHLKLWQILMRDSPVPIDIENKVFSLTKTQNGFTPQM